MGNNGLPIEPRQHGNTFERAVGVGASATAGAALGAATIFSIGVLYRDSSPSLSAFQQNVERVASYTPAAPAELTLPPAIAEIRSSSPDVSEKAILAASSLWGYLRGALLTPQRVHATRSGSIACSFFKELRYAVLECDEDGDIILTLTDRSRDESADDYFVVTSALYDVPRRIQRFLEG